MFTMAQAKTAGLEVGTLLKLVLEQNEMTSANSAKYKTIADFIYDQYSGMSFNVLNISEVDTETANLLGFYLKKHSNGVIKFVKLFETTNFADTGTYKTQTFKDIINYKNQTNETYGRNVANENSPIGKTASDGITTPNSKGSLSDNTQKVAEDLENTETITNTELEHEPLADAEKLEKGGKTLYGIIDKWIQQIIYEYNVAI